MNPQQALALLEQATGLLTLTRADHQKVVEALQTLARVVSPPAPAEATASAQPEN